MAEGAPPGAPNISGTEEDPAYFLHQPPPVDGVNFGSQPTSDIPEPIDHYEATPSRTASPDSIRQAIADLSLPGSQPFIAPTRPATPVDGAFHPEPSPGSPGSRPHARARFPSDAGKLFRTYSAPKPESKRADSLAYDGEKDQNSNGERRGGWQSVRSWITQWTEGLGWPEKHQDIQDIMGDAGIDMDVIRKAKKSAKGKGHKKVSSLVGSSMTLARPGLGSRTESSSTIPIHAASGAGSGAASGVASGMATPGTLRRIFGAGVDPFELQSALRKLKGKLSQRDSKQAKYVQAKAELAHRRNLVLLVVYAFMSYGAPSHRLEQYTLQLFKALEMDGRVNYTVGCMEISFINPIDPEDPMTRSAYTTLVKAQGLDVGACDLAFRTYKEVIAGEMDVEDAIAKLTELIESPSYYEPLFMIPLYGVSSALTCVWAFGGYWGDMVISFLLGTLVGLLQIVLAAKNTLYSNVLEVTASLITSFGARAFASIGGPGQKYFCFGAIAQSSIATILPGYTVLTGTLELQSKSITAGSTRLFYAVIYSLLLGYGMSVGSQIWAAFYPEAPTSATCPRTIDDRWSILLVPAYIVCQSIIIRSRPSQIPVQVLIGSTAYAVNYFVSKKTTAQVADTASALVLGILGHLWARSQRAFAFAAVVAGIMCLVPGGLAAQGGLTAGITSSLYTNGSAETESVYQTNIYRSFGVGAQMIEVAVGLAVGIFLSALIVYPFGKKNNALFSF